MENEQSNLNLENQPTPSAGQVPPPPQEEVTIRTMQSDIKSMEQAGGGTPVPEAIIPSELEKEGPMFQPETISQLPEGVSSQGKKTFKVLALIGGILILLVVLSLAGYYIVYPLIFPAQPEQPATQPPGEAQPPAPTLKPHQSLFISAPATTAKINLDLLNLFVISSALQTEAAAKIADGSIKELSISNTEGQIDFSRYLPAILPTFTADELTNIFESDFTAFLFYDEKGIWPGYIAKLKSGVDSAAITAMAPKFEAAELANLFLAPPGAMVGFKNGAINNYATRYAAFSASGAALNYGFFGDYFIISASYSGLRAALQLLGL